MTLLIFDSADAIKVFVFEHELAELAKEANGCWLGSTNEYKYDNRVKGFLDDVGQGIYDSCLVVEDVIEGAFSLSVAGEVA